MENPFKGIDERGCDFFLCPSAEEAKGRKEQVQRATDIGGREGFARDQGGQGMRGVPTSQGS